MLRLRTPLTEEELFALQTLAEHEMRSPAEQAHFIIRKELVECGLLHVKIEFQQKTIAAPETLCGETRLEKCKSTILEAQDEK